MVCDTASSTFTAVVFSAGLLCQALSDERRLAIAFRAEKQKTLAAAAKSLRVAAASTAPLK